jgi:hypothetical protein
LAAWTREHGPANQMTLVSSDEVNSTGRRVLLLRCSACGTDIRGSCVTKFQQHANSAAHAAALHPGCRAESKPTAWLRDHGPLNQMTFVSNDNFRACGQRVWVIHCGVCDADITGDSVRNFRKHANSAAHAAALHPGCGRESPLAALIRERGPANQMMLVSSAEINSTGRRVSLQR